MSDLKRTELRHKMLAAVAEGGIAEFDGYWIRASRDGQNERLSSTESRVLDELGDSSHIYVDTTCGGNQVELWLPVDIRDAGSRLLSEWDARYGEVQL